MFYTRTLTVGISVVSSPPCQAQTTPDYFRRQNAHSETLPTEPWELLYRISLLKYVLGTTELPSMPWGTAPSRDSIAVIQDSQVFRLTCMEVANSALKQGYKFDELWQDGSFKSCGIVEVLLLKTRLKSPHRNLLWNQPVVPLAISFTALQTSFVMTVISRFKTRQCLRIPRHLGSPGGQSKPWRVVGDTIRNIILDKEYTLELPALAITDTPQTRSDIGSGGLSELNINDFVEMMPQWAVRIVKTADPAGLVARMLPGNLISPSARHLAACFWSCLCIIDGEFADRSCTIWH